MFDLVVVPVIVNGGGLSPEEKKLLLNFFCLAISGTGWMMFFQFVFGRIDSFIKFILSKFNKDRNDKK